jgi:hypothetical protein
MHPVVGANGDDTAAIVVSWGSALRVTDDLHGASRYRFGKHDARLGHVSTVFVHRNETLVFIRNHPRTVTVEERQRSTIADHLHDRLIDDDGGHPAQCVTRRTEDCGLERLGVFEIEWADRGAAKVAQVRTPAECGADVCGKGADVGTR